MANERAHMKPQGDNRWPQAIVVAGKTKSGIQPPACAAASFLVVAITSMLYQIGYLQNSTVVRVWKNPGDSH